MKSKKSDIKLGLYSDKELTLLPISSVYINVKIINKFSTLSLTHIYKNPYNIVTSATFFIPKECATIFKSLTVVYNNKVYQGIIGNKAINTINYAEDSQLGVHEYNEYRKKYLFFNLRDIQPNQEIKIEISFIEILETKKNIIKYIIQKIYTPTPKSTQLSNELFYDYKYEIIINVMNTKKIKRLFCNMKNIELNKINNNEYIIKYSNNICKMKDNFFTIEYSTEEINEKENVADIITMKHPLFENDYMAYISVNPKNLIKKIHFNRCESIRIDKIIIMVNIHYINNNLKERIIQSIVYLLKSLPENTCFFKIFFYQALFDDFMKVNQNNIMNALDKMEKYDFIGNWNHLPSKKYFLENIISIKKGIEKGKDNKMETRVFIIGEEFNEINEVLNEIHDLPNNYRFYTIINPHLYHNEEVKYFKKYKDFMSRFEIDISEEVKEISRRTNGNWAYYNNNDDIPDLLIEMYNESLYDYIHDISISFLNDDNSIKCVQKEKYSINSNIELLINMSKHNRIKLNFKYNEASYELACDINLSEAVIDDILHKIFYYKYYFSDIILDDNIINTMNKYQILTEMNELYIDLKDDKNIMEKINKKRNKEIIFKSKGYKIHLYFKTLSQKIIEIFIYREYTIKEAKILVELISNIPHKEQRFIYCGKASIFDDRVLSDYNIENEGTIHLVLRPEIKKGLIFKNYFDLYDYKNIYLLIINQKLSGIWEYNENNIKLIEKYGISFSDFCKNLEDNNMIVHDEHILFTVFVISYLNMFHCKKRYEKIIEKGRDSIKKNVEGYNEDMQRMFDGLIQYL